jgi:hypothetical protein
MMHLPTDQRDAYELALATDVIWMGEIKRAFPRERAGDVRYTERAHGAAGSSLRAAYERYAAARDHYSNTWLRRA